MVVLPIPTLAQAHWRGQAQAQRLFEHAGRPSRRGVSHEDVAAIMRRAPRAGMAKYLGLLLYAGGSLLLVEFGKVRMKVCDARRWFFFRWYEAAEVDNAGGGCFPFILRSAVLARR